MPKYQIRLHQEQKTHPTHAERETPRQHTLRQRSGNNMYMASEEQNPQNAGRVMCESQVLIFRQDATKQKVEVPKETKKKAVFFPPLFKPWKVACPLAATGIENNTFYRRRGPLQKLIISTN